MRTHHFGFFLPSPSIEWASDSIAPNAWRHFSFCRFWLNVLNRACPLNCFIFSFFLRRPALATFEDSGSCSSPTSAMTWIATWIFTSVSQPSLSLLPPQLDFPYSHCSGKWFSRCPLCPPVSPVIHCCHDFTTFDLVFQSTPVLPCLTWVVGVLQHIHVGSILSNTSKHVLWSSAKIFPLAGFALHLFNANSFLRNPHWVTAMEIGWGACFGASSSHLGLSIG